MNKDDWHSQTSFTLTPFNAMSAMSFSRESACSRQAAIVSGMSALRGDCATAAA